MTNSPLTLLEKKMVGRCSTPFSSSVRSICSRHSKHWSSRPDAKSNLRLDQKKEERKEPEEEEEKKKKKKKTKTDQRKKHQREGKKDSAARTGRFRA